MPPKIVLVRHAQALHNVENKFPADYSIHDPPLSQLGQEQLINLRKSLQERYGHVGPEDVAVITSPMRRTCETALGSIDWLLEKGVKIIADGDWQENSAKPCDTGSDPKTLATEFPQVDFQPLDITCYPDKTSSSSPYLPTRPSILSRGNRVMASLYRRPEKVIIVFSHSGFLRTGCVGWWFFNSDYRVFNFVQNPQGMEDWRGSVEPEEGTLNGGLGLSRDERVELGAGVPENGDGMYT